MATKPSVKFAGMFLEMKGPRGRRCQWNYWGFLFSFCFVHKPLKTSCESTSGHNILISQLCSFSWKNRQYFYSEIIWPELLWYYQPSLAVDPNAVVFSLKGCCSAWSFLASFSKRTAWSSRRLWFKKQTVSPFWSQMVNTALTMTILLQQPRKWNRLTNAITIRWVPGGRAAFRTPDIGLQSV